VKLFRYLAKEVLYLFVGVTFVLLIIFLSNQWLRYLSRVAAGNLPLDTIWHLLLLSVPQLLGLLMPLGLFFAMLAAYGRLYAENEMTAMFACGMSLRRLVMISLGLASIVALLVALMSLWLSPIINKQRQQLLRQGGLALIVDALLPGRFQQLDKRGTAVYVQNISEDRNALEGIFLARRDANNPNWDVLIAKSGILRENPDTEQREVVLQKGKRYQGQPGENDFKITEFKNFALEIKPSTSLLLPNNVKSLSTNYLWQHYQNNPANAAEFQWRVSVPLMALVLGLLVVPLSRVTPRQGRYAKIFPATLIMLVYANFLFFIRNWMIHGEFPIFPGLWGLHAAFVLFALILMMWPMLKYKQVFRRGAS
jgi:lipopolysaccharide export system permease protein